MDQKASFLGYFTKKYSCIQKCLENKTQHENIYHPFKVPDHAILQKFIENSN